MRQWDCSLVREREPGGTGRDGRDGRECIIAMLNFEKIEQNYQRNLIARHLLECLNIVSDKNYKLRYMDEYEIFIDDVLVFQSWNIRDVNDFLSTLLDGRQKMGKRWLQFEEDGIIASKREVV